MKKSILFGGLAALVLGMSACSGNAAGGADTTYADSLATAFGQAQGSSYANMVKENMPEEMKKKFNQESFLRGLKQVMLSDTADQGYLVGLNVGMQMMQSAEMWRQQAGVDVPMQKLYENFAASFKSPMDQDAQTAANAELQALLGKLQDMARQKYEESQKAAQAASEQEAKVNIEAGAKYVEEQKAKDADIKTTADGLSYKVIKQGTGAMPTDKDKVKVIYTGKLVDGTEFDSSKGQAVEFPVSGVVPGFAEALKMMNKGSKYIAYIPADLGYGNSANGSIPAGSTLVFEIEVTDIIPGN